MIKVRLRGNYKYAGFPRLLPVGSWRDSRADQGQRHEHEVAVTRISFIWGMLREVCIWGKSLIIGKLHCGAQTQKGRGERHSLGQWDQRGGGRIGDVPGQCGQETLGHRTKGSSGLGSL